MFLLSLVAITIPIATAQIDQIRSNPLGSTLLDTIQMHMQSQEPIQNLVDLMNGINDSILKHQRNAQQNYTRDNDACNYDISQQKELLIELHTLKMSLKDDIQLLKPRLDQIAVVQNSKHREQDILHNQLQISNDRIKQQKELYAYYTKKLNEQRYDYVSYKIPFKADPKDLKPVISKLVDFVNEMLTFENKVIDSKQTAYELHIAQIYEQLDLIDEVLDNLKDEEEEIKRKLFGLEIDLDETQKKFDRKSNILQDIYQECQEQSVSYDAMMKELNEQYRIVHLTADLIEYKYGWLRQQLGL